MPVRTRVYKIAVRFVAMSFVLAILLGSVPGAGAEWKGQNVTLAPDLDYSVYLPLMGHVTVTQLDTVSGFEVDRTADYNEFLIANQIGISWARFSVNGIKWSRLQPEMNGPYLWDQVANIETALAQYSELGAEIILNIYGTPDWAQLIPPYSCGPMKQEFVDDFGNFVQAVVSRYSAPPFNVKYYEFWNEPDAPPNVDYPDGPFGCWADSSLPSKGAVYYAQVLQTFYAKAKAANPDSVVLTGGLLMDCDPALDSCDSPNYLKGILENGGGSYFDGVAFHAYDYFSYKVGEYKNPVWNAAWNTTGPVGVAKVAYINNLLSQHGVTGKILLNTENALLCDFCDGREDYEITKAYYIAESFASSIATGLVGNIWYSPYGWRGSYLIKRDGSLTLAYDAMQASRRILRNAAYIGTVDEGPGVRGYRFRVGKDEVWFLYSVDGAAHNLALGKAPAAALNVYGNLLPAIANINLTREPLYLIFASD